MFSSVGRPSRPPRRAGPLLLSLLLNAGTIGALFALGADKVEEVVAAEVGVERPYELRVPDAGSPAPAPSAPKARRAAAKVSVPVAPVPVAEPVAAVTVVPEPAATGPTDGPTDGDGVADLGGDGTGDGTGSGGDGDGAGLGSGSGVRTVHWSEVAVKTRATVRPSDYPAAASALNLPDTRCVVRIQIDEKGRPYDVVVKTCPEVFRAAADTVARRYRFHPLLDEGGRPVKAGFDLTLNFRRGD